MRRIVFRKYDAATSQWSVPLTLEADDLGQDTQMTVNVAPRKTSRSSAVGTTETPIPGTFDSLSASVTFLPSTWELLGEAISNWSAATYADASDAEGQILWGDGSSFCAGGDYMSVVAQGLCDDGSAADIEIARCIPSIDDDIELGTSDAISVTLNLNPIIYNEKLHASDGYGAFTVRAGVQDLTKKTRLNAVTGEYADVTVSQ